MNGQQSSFRRVFRRFVVLAGLVAAAWTVTAPGRAEVAAELDADGSYRRMIVLGNASTKNLKVWQVSRTLDRTVPLNPGGDLNGDLWPAILEVPSEGNRPWVVWSRFNGTDYDLAWSRWLEDGRWSDVAWVTLTPGMPGQDLAPSLDHGASDGRPYLVWINDDGTGGQVYLSLFLRATWMRPYRVSDADEDARLPTVTVIDEDTIQVTYETDSGTRTRVVRFLRPTTITDDANPFEHLKMDDGVSETLSAGGNGP